MPARAPTRSNPFMPPRIHDPQPLSALNITPLIDVLLVLIVMLILTIPMVTHKVPVDLNGPGDPPVTTPPTVHRIAIARDGALTWDAAALADAALPARLAAMRREDNVQLEIAADGEATYDRFDHILATIKQAGITKLGFVGNERFVTEGTTAR
ncbi:ExbD/TolR family protein [Sphingomonas immobilis]|uniref:Biopolymer transporter ExbD n=1 Tax=Sphingomonas immobilis TaxID=3063997 RepID=A0ABT9A1G9_9SPHN|nr:biopolymer transporter ExbD [Sphingomonas sp. CA1-15]MDO7843229.1 biopolymer transporter ExbD [Sphingomonas sp. CA1-15]